MRENNKHGEANSGDQRPSPINRRAVLRGAVATGASGALAGCLGTFEREYEATPATVPEETASEHNLDPTPEVKKRSGTISQGLGVATIEADVTGYTTTYVYQGDEQQTKEPTAEPTSTPTRTPEPTSTSTPTHTPEPTTTPTDPQTAPEDEDDDDDDADQGSPETPPPTAVTFTDKRVQRTEDGFVAVVDSARLNQGGFIALRKGNLSGNVTGVSDHLEPGEHVNVRVRLDESISGDVTLHAVARKADGNNIFDPATDQTYMKNGQPISDSAVVQLPEGPSVDPVKPDTLNINSTPNPNFVGQSLNPAATTSIENLIEEETEAFEQACNCTIEKPGQVEVKSVDPTDAQLSREDIGKTVFHLDKESEVLTDAPKSTELLGDEKPIELFLIPSSGDQENVVNADLIAATKTIGQLQSGTQEAVVASYISTISTLFELGIHLIESDTSSTSSTLTPTPTGTPTPTPDSETTSGGMYSPEDVEYVTGQLDGVCPDISGGTPETETPTAPPTATPQPVVSWDGRYGRNGVLKEVVFASETGVIRIQFDHAVGAGNQVSANIEHTSGDGLDFSQYAVTVAGARTRITGDGWLRTKLPEGKGTVDVILTHASAGEVATASLPVITEFNGRYTMPAADQSVSAIQTALRNNDYRYIDQRIGEVGGPFAVYGLFNGDKSTTTAAVEGTEVPIIAQSHRESVVQLPEKTVGQTRITMRERNNTVDHPIWVIASQMTGPSEIGSQGEETIAVELQGLENLDEMSLPAAFLTLRNQNPGQTQLEGGNTQTKWLFHENVHDGRYENTFTITGEQDANVAVEDSVTPGPPQGQEIAYPSSTILASPWDQLPKPKDIDDDFRLSDTPRKKHEQVKIRQLELELVELFKNCHDDIDKELSTVTHEALAIAECLVETAFHLLLEKGYQRGFIMGTTFSSLCQKFELGDVKGRCGDWRKAIAKQINKKRRNDKLDFECFDWWQKAQAVTADGEEKVDHVTVIIWPSGCSWKEGLVFDPWRLAWGAPPLPSEQEYYRTKAFPPWFRVKNDPDYNWKVNK